MAWRRYDRGQSLKVNRDRLIGDDQSGILSAAPSLCIMLSFSQDHWTPLTWWSTSSLWKIQDYTDRMRLNSREKLGIVYGRFSLALTSSLAAYNKSNRYGWILGKFIINHQLGYLVAWSLINGTHQRTRWSSSSHCSVFMRHEPDVLQFRFDETVHLCEQFEAAGMIIIYLLFLEWTSRPRNRQKSPLHKEGYRILIRVPMSTGAPATGNGWFV